MEETQQGVVQEHGLFYLCCTYVVLAWPCSPLWNAPVRQSDRAHFNLFGPGPAACPISLSPLSAHSCEVPSLKCNHREAGMGGWRMDGDMEKQRRRSRLSLVSSPSSERVLQCCNRLDHKLKSIYPISRSIRRTPSSALPTHQLRANCALSMSCVRHFTSLNSLFSFQKG